MGRKIVGSGGVRRDDLCVGEIENVGNGVADNWYVGDACFTNWMMVTEDIET